ncbi:hypothetical protein PG993_003995 [Apiospora rasikravindrae]|uniref:Uncharacterized protein n=1 Tax=Apiospora rasikravindrae TaxID=990691 RepID=A0ABR1S227_9PEZI
MPRPGYDTTATDRTASYTNMNMDLLQRRNDDHDDTTSPGVRTNASEGDRNQHKSRDGSRGSPTPRPRSK